MKLKKITKLALAALVATFGSASEADTLKWTVGIGDLGKYEIGTYFFLASDDKGLFSSMKTTTISDVIAAWNAGTKFDTSTYFEYGSNNGSNTYLYKKDVSTSSEKMAGASFFAFVYNKTTFEYLIAKNSEGQAILTAAHNEYSSANNYDWIWDWGNQSSDSWIAQGSVPEPTSGILLLVGVAALALKRKKAA